MKVRYTDKGKYEYEGRQYLSGSIIDFKEKDIDRLDMNRFEYVPKTKANIELRKVRDLLKTIEADIDDLKAYHKQYKDRESKLLNDMNKLNVVTEKIPVKDIKKIKKEVD
jgi:hypothetical protein